MHPCQEGYPCVYLKVIDSSRGTCMCAHCPMKKVGLPTDDKDYVYDSLTGLVTEGVTVPPPKPKRDPLDQWYEDFTERELGKAMSSVDTYERKHGAMRPKRYVAVR